MNAPSRPLPAEPLLSRPKAPPTASDGVDRLAAQVRGMIRDGRALAARHLLDALRRRGLAGDEATALEARVLALEGHGAAALRLVGAALARADAAAALYLCRAELHLRDGNHAAAATDAAEAVLRDPARADAKGCLGMALAQLGRFREAVACLREAVAADPRRADWQQCLVYAFEMSGAAEEAARALAAAVAANPGQVGLRIAAILRQMHRGDHAAAAALAMAARRDGVADACVLGLLGHALSSLGRHGEAALVYEEARKLAPEDPYVRHLAATAALSPSEGRATPEYVSVVFDGYATRFDAHLISLGYRVPGLIRHAVAPRAGAGGRLGPVLDLGCGTGLVGVALSDLAPEAMVGVDLSALMLAEARKRGLYAELHQADITHYLRHETRQFDLIVAGDVFPYFGDLAPLLLLAAACLAPGGELLCSVEALPADADAAWRLGRLGRFAHAESHLRAAAAAAGLRARFIRPECIRMEGCLPVAGRLAAFTRALP